MSTAALREIEVCAAIRRQLRPNQGIPDQFGSFLLRFQRTAITLVD
jgi:hypothetical protein